MSRAHAITSWDPEDTEFWQADGRRIARRNMWTSVFAEHVGFCVWSLWSVLVLFMRPKSGFGLSTADKFLLTSLVTLVGSLVRPGYGWAVARFGGRTWTVTSAVLLLIPVAGATILLGHPHAPLWAFLLCAGVSGIGGGSFASSTTNINFFFPEREKGRALGVNAGAGNMGVASVQMLGLLVIAAAGATTLTIVASTARSLPLFICAFTALFALSGLANGSTYAMINRPYAARAERAIADGADATGARLDARRRAGAVIAFAGTVGGLGGVGINLAFRQSYLQAHTVRPALAGFLVCYAVCVAVTVLAGGRAAVPAPAPAGEGQRRRMVSTAQSTRGRG